MENDNSSPIVRREMDADEAQLYEWEDCTTRKRTFRNDPVTLDEIEISMHLQYAEKHGASGLDRNEVAHIDKEARAAYNAILTSPISLDVIASLARSGKPLEIAYDDHDLPLEISVENYITREKYSILIKRVD